MGRDRGCVGSLYYGRIECVADTVAKASANACCAVKHWALRKWGELICRSLSTAEEKEVWYFQSSCPQSALAAVVTKLL